MSLNLRIVPRETHLYTVITGIYTLQEAKNAALDIFKECVVHKASKVFIDFRLLQIKSSTMEDFELGEFVASAYQAHLANGYPYIKFVYLAKAPLNSIDLFGENVSVNRGLNVKFTDDFLEACNWLEIDPTNAGLESNNEVSSG